MGKLVKIAALGVGAVGVFSGSVALFLMSRGDLNREGLSRVPVVGSFFPAPDPVDDPASPEGDAESEGEPGESASTGDAGADAVTTTDAAAAEKTNVPSRPRSELFDRAGAYEPGEMDTILADLAQARASYDSRLSGLDSRDAALDIEAEELSDRRAQLQQLVDSLELERVELVRERKRMEQSWVKFEESEAANIKKLGKKLEGMAPDKLSAALDEMEKSDVVKILSSMNDRRAAKVFDAMAPEDAAEIMELMKGLVDETKTTGATGN